MPKKNPAQNSSVKLNLCSKIKPVLKGTVCQNPQMYRILNVRKWFSHCVCLSPVQVYCMGMAISKWKWTRPILTQLHRIWFCIQEGKLKEARECFQRCVDITPDMAREVIRACNQRNVDCIVAPYEADAQLAFLATTGGTEKQQKNSIILKTELQGRTYWVFVNYTENVK